MTDEPAELEQLRHAARQDRDLLGDIMMRHQDRLLRMVKLRLDRRLGQRVDPADVVQEAFIEATARIEDYLGDPAVPFFVWLRFITAQRLAALHRHHLGTKARDAGREISIHHGPLPQATSAVLAECLVGRLTSPTQAAMRGEMRLRIEEALNAMPEIDREVIALRHFEHLTNSETAKVLGLREGAAWARYARALAKLKQALAHLDGPVSGAGWEEAKR